MNILVINGSSDLYGANRILVETLDVLVKTDRVFLVLPSDGPLCNFIKDRIPSIELLIIPTLPTVARKMFSPLGVLGAIYKFLSSYYALKKIVRRNRIQIAYINTLSCFFSIKQMQLMGLRTFVHIHEIIESPKIAANLINKLSLRWMTWGIAVSRAVFDNLTCFVSKEVVAQKVTILSNGIPDALYSPVRQPLSEGEIVVSLIARIKPEKGVWFFLDAIANLSKKEARAAMFYIVGGPAPNGEHYVEQLKKDIRHHLYHDRITYLDFIPNVNDIQKSSDILVIPSTMKDPFPTTVLEAMRAGKPVIATDNGGAAEAVQDEVTGYLIKPGYVTAFADKLTVLINDSNKRMDFGRNGRGRYETEFAQKQFENKINALMIKLKRNQQA